MRRLADNINISIVAVLAWGCLELVEVKAKVSEINARQELVLDMIKKQLNEKSNVQKTHLVEK